MCWYVMNSVRKALSPLSSAFLRFFVSGTAAHKLQSLAVGCGSDVGKLVDLALGFEYNPRVHPSWAVNIKPLQVKSEIARLCRIVQELNPKTIVEIGTASGGTLFLFAHIANPERIVSIDLPQGPFGGGYPSWKIPLLKSLGKKHVVQLIRADSHQEETLAKLRSFLGSGEVDFLFIDGDHTYRGVKLDFDMYSPLVRKGGVVALHDIVAHDANTGCEVGAFWSEIKQSHRHLEIIEDQNQRWAGIGVLCL